MTDVVMPQMGESIVEGTLTKWLKKPGDKVERDEPLFEISTDKVDTEIPSPMAGTLSEILVQEGTTVSINAVVGRIGDGANGSAAPPAQEAAPAQAEQPAQQPAPAAPPPQQPASPPPQPAPQQSAPQQTDSAMPEPAGAGSYPTEPAPQQAQTPQSTQDDDQGPLSPLVRKMAREYNIDLLQVKGTGAGGRITKQDVEAYMSSQAAKTYSAPSGAAAAQPPSSPSPSAAQDKPAAVAEGKAPLPRAEAAKTRIEPLSTMRQKIAEHMVNSVRTSPHVTTVHRVDMTKVAKMRDKSKAEFQGRNGFSLTFLPFIAAAAAEALRAFPIVNASLDGTNVVYHNEINLGIAVALENGLIVPVIRNSDEKNVAGLQRSIVDLATRARSRQLKPDEVQGGTFSITNFGSFGSIFATPIINQPQVAILGVGAVEKVAAVVEGDAIAIRQQAHLALTFDHRLIDGALADQFVQKVKQVLENWSTSIL